MQVMEDSHLVTKDLIKEVVKSPDPNSHKNQNGRILIIGGSPLFHGAGRLSTRAVLETLIAISSRTNDMVYFASTEDNLKVLKGEQGVFIGINREQIDRYLSHCEVVLVGTGLMREEEPGRSETKGEPEKTKELTMKVINSGKKAVLDAGSLQVISKEDLKGENQIIITPHQKEMSKLFDIDVTSLKTSHESSFPEIEKIAKIVEDLAKEYEITILLKGAVDIVASKDGWMYVKGGNAGMTKGGTGDVLAGVVAALYSRSNDPLKVASSASLITKMAGDELYKEDLWIFNATDLADKISGTLTSVLVNSLR